MYAVESYEAVLGIANEMLTELREHTIWMSEVDQERWNHTGNLLDTLTAMRNKDRFITAVNESNASESPAEENSEDTIPF